MNDIQIFQFEGNEVRTVIGVDGEPWWVAADVCHAIGIGNVTMAVAPLYDDEKGFNSIETLGGFQQVITISEPGLYSLIGNSRKPEAKRLLRFVNHEVLPNLRKYGRYDSDMAGCTSSQLEMIEADPGYQQSLRLLKLTRDHILHRERLAQVEREQKEIVNNLKTVETIAVEAKADSREALNCVYGNNDMVAIMGFCSRKNMYISEPHSARVGRALTNYCRKNGIYYGKASEGKGAHNERHDGVNTYPREILNQWYNGEIDGGGIYVENNCVFDARRS